MCLDPLSLCVGSGSLVLCNFQNCGSLAAAVVVARIGRSSLTLQAGQFVELQPSATVVLNCVCAASVTALGTPVPTARRPSLQRATPLVPALSRGTRFVWQWVLPVVCLKL